MRAASVRLVTLALLSCCAWLGAQEVPRETSLSGPGWRIWRDAAADWPNEPPLAPGVPLAELPVRPPSAGWDVLATGREVSVPNTLEGLFGERETDPRGVSWWSRTLQIPARVLAEREAWHVELIFESVGRRAEVYLGRGLVGRDDVGHSRFVVDLDALPLAASQALDVRVTDPGGNFGWEDEDAHRWGDASVPAAHGFGGLLGDVHLRLTPAAHVAELSWRSDAELQGGVAQLELVHRGVGGTLPLELEVWDPASRPPTLLARARREQSLAEIPGRQLVEVPLALPDAPRWSPRDPRLLKLRVRFGEDRVELPIGLRHFELAGLGEDAQLRLNGERILLRSAISWGYWPRTGAIPSHQLARRQVEAARAFGLNMLNHHRNFPHPRLLSVHDRLGLLAYVEPGGYASVGGDDTARALARERWLRLIREARRHPSVVIANMINEAKSAPTAQQRQDLADAQRLAPNLLLTYTSAWAASDAEALSLHARPGEPGLHTRGWWDQHNAPGPGVWRDEFWKGPDEHLLRHEDRESVVFLGEDGAIGAPPRLAGLLGEWGPHSFGWDGAAYAARLASWRADLSSKSWPADPAAIDALAASLGDVAVDYHARVLENLRLDGVVDGYVINGWDDQKGENHSGIVDARRRPKGDPARLAAAAAPRLLAIKPRASVLQARPLYQGARLATALTLDLGLLDETGLVGAYDWELSARGGTGPVLAEARGRIQLDGAPDTRWLLREHVLELAADPGWVLLRATLRAVDDDAATTDAAAAPLVEAEERVLVVDGRHRPLPEGGAVLGPGRERINAWLDSSRRGRLRGWNEDRDDVDWVLLTGLDPEPMERVPNSALRVSEAADAEPGLRFRLFAGDDFQHVVRSGVHESLHVAHDRAAWPADLELPFSMRWTGALIAPEDGLYRLRLLSSGGVRLWLDDELLLEQWPDHRPDRITSRAVELEAGELVSLRVDYLQQKDASRVSLEWSRPSSAAAVRYVGERLLRAVAEDGLDLVVLDHADGWARELQRQGSLSAVERLQMDRYWLGGGFFARPHPLLEGLPAEGALGRHWQTLVHYGQPLWALRAPELQRVIGATTDHDPRLGTALGWVPHGRGRVLLCSLDVLSALEKGPGAADLARHLLQNMIEWGGR